MNTSNFQKYMAVVLFAALMMVSIEAAPSPSAEWDRNNNPCIYEEMKSEVCQRCAKQTKSPIVYPMCCNNEDNVYDWCDRFIHYGRQP